MPTVPTVTSERRLQQQGQASAPSLTRSGYTPRVSGGSGELMGKAVQNLGETVTKVANVMFERQVEENKILQKIAEKERQHKQALQVLALEDKTYKFALGVENTRDNFDFIKPDGTLAVWDYGVEAEKQFRKLEDEIKKTVTDQDVLLPTLQNLYKVKHGVLNRGASWGHKRDNEYNQEVIDSSISNLKYEIDGYILDGVEVSDIEDIFVLMNGQFDRINAIGNYPTHVQRDRQRDVLEHMVNRLGEKNPELAIETIKVIQRELDPEWAGKKLKALEVPKTAQNSRNAQAFLQSFGSNVRAAREAAENIENQKRFDQTPEQMQNAFSLYEEDIIDRFFESAIKIGNQEFALEYAYDEKLGLSSAGKEKLATRINNHFQRIKTAQDNEQKRVGEELTKAATTAMSRGETPNLEEIYQFEDKIPAEDYKNIIDAINKFSDWPEYSNPKTYMALSTVVYDKDISSAILEAKGAGHLSESDFKYLTDKNATQENLRRKAEQDKTDKSTEAKDREDQRLFNEAHKYWDKWLQDKLEDNSIIARSELLEAIRDRSVKTIEDIQAKAIVLASGKTSKKTLGQLRKEAKVEIGGINISDTYRGLAQTIFTQMGVEIPNNYDLINMKNAGVTEDDLKEFSLYQERFKRNLPVSAKFLLATQLAVDANDGEIGESRAWEILDWYSKPFNELVMHASDADLLLLKQAFPGLNLKTGNIERQ